jgi:hypothetical protein
VRRKPPSPGAHGREKPRLPLDPGRAPHTEPMAGSPLRRARKQGISLEDGRVIAFPRMPRVASLPKGWRHLSPAKKIEHLLGLRLDRAAQML